VTETAPNEAQVRQAEKPQAPEASTKGKNPSPPAAPPVRLGRLRNASDIRCAFKCLGNAVLAGKLDPKRANSAMYAVAGAARALEIELTEEALRAASALRMRRNTGGVISQEAEVIDARLRLSAPESEGLGGLRAELESLQGSEPTPGNGEDTPL
jgi:hypothetical protein